MRTLVISDLHLGQGGGISVLTRPAPMRALTAAVTRHDRLVLLGDVLEMQEANAERSLRVAAPVLAEIAAAVGDRGELWVVPGNHDHLLIQQWAEAQGERLGLADEVPLDASRMLASLCASLSATNVSVFYPGVWLSPRVWATHGHHLANYLRPMSSWGLHPRRADWGPATVAALEPAAASRREHVQDGLPAPRWTDRLIPIPLAPVSSRLLGRQMLRHSLPAFATCLQALAVDADHVVFGHVHRRGPREGEDPQRWRVAASGPRLANTGSWRFEPVVSHGLDARSNYWPGGAVTIGEDGIPHSIGLLDGFSEAQILAR
ncbi:MAG: metallophosphoesterase [Solirubrobacteraceae bacterium]